MAKPIEPTPVLRGKDAEAFLKAMKGWRWVTRMLRERLEEFKAILNREVLVKNAKV